MHTKQKRHLIETRRRKDGPDPAIGRSKWIQVNPREVGPYLSRGIVGRSRSEWAHHCSSFLSGSLSEDVTVHSCQRNGMDLRKGVRKMKSMLFIFSPPFFWSVFIGSLVQRMRKMIFLAWFWPVTPQLPCPFSICESCDERDHWALWNLVHSYYNIRAGFLDNPVLESFIHCLVSAKRAICAKNGDLAFLWSVNHYANVYLHQRKTVKRDTADGKIDKTSLVFDY